MTELASERIWQPAAQQQSFRRLMRAFAYPGRTADLAESRTSALTAVLATLVDGAVGLADPHRLVAEPDWPRLEARRELPERADFVVLSGAQTPDFLPRLGTLESPERGATLILRVTALDAGARLRLTGPGIDGVAWLSVTGLDPAWLATRRRWCATFPLGVDLILVDQMRAVCLPRTTQVEEEG